MFGQGISKLGEIVDIGAKMGIVNKSGAWFSYGDIRLGQGRDNAKEYLKRNPEVAKEIEDKVFAAIEEAKNSGFNPLSDKKKPGKTVVSTTATEPKKEEEAPAEKPVTKRRSANIDIDVE